MNKVRFSRRKFKKHGYFSAEKFLVLASAKLASLFKFTTPKSYFVLFKAEYK